MQKQFNILILGKQGSGKSSLIKYLTKQDVPISDGFNVCTMELKLYTCEGNTNFNLEDKQIQFIDSFPFEIYFDKLKNHQKKYNDLSQNFKNLVLEEIKKLGIEKVDFVFIINSFSEYPSFIQSIFSLTQNNYPSMVIMTKANIFQDENENSKYYRIYKKRLDEQQSFCQQNQIQIQEIITPFYDTTINQQFDIDSETNVNQLNELMVKIKSSLIKEVQNVETNHINQQKNLQEKTNNKQISQTAEIYQNIKRILLVSNKNKFSKIEKHSNEIKRKYYVQLVHHLEIKSSEYQIFNFIFIDSELKQQEQSFQKIFGHRQNYQYIDFKNYYLKYFEKLIKEPENNPFHFEQNQLNFKDIQILDDQDDSWIPCYCSLI